MCNPQPEKQLKFCFIKGLTLIPHKHFKTLSMFDQILQLVKEHLNSNPELTGNMPAEKADEVHREIATHITNGLQSQAPESDSGGGILSQLEHSLASGNLPTSA